MFRTRKAGYQEPMNAVGVYLLLSFGCIYVENWSLPHE